MAGNEYIFSFMALLYVRTNFSQVSVPAGCYKTPAQWQVVYIALKFGYASSNTFGIIARFTMGFM